MTTAVSEPQTLNWTESPRFAGGPGPMTAYRGSQLLKLTTFHGTLGEGFDSESRIQPSTDGPMLRTQWAA